MTVIMQKGRRRCDARCYHAYGKVCTCICGGLNHGVGFEQQAIENTREALEELSGDKDVRFSIEVLYTQPFLVPHPEPEVV